MEWQLTSDYSVLTGDGIYGDKGPLRPTQRFWNLKQLGSTSAGLFALPAISNNNSISCAAFGSKLNNKYAIHMVNNGPTRQVTIQGIPAETKSMTIWITNALSGMQKAGLAEVKNGKITLMVEKQSFITLTNQFDSH
jgi:hypothetical protein